MDMFSNVDGQLASQIAAGIGSTPPAHPGGTGVAASSPAVSQEKTIRTARTRKVAILADNGFNYPEVTQVMEALKGAGVHAEIISKSQGMITGVDGRQLEVNKNYIAAGLVMCDAVYVPGGRQSIDALMAQGDSLHFVNEAFKHAKAIGATNEGVDLLTASQIRGVAMAVPETHAQLVNNIGVATIRNAADMGNLGQDGYFSQEFINNIARHRHWVRENYKKMPA